MAHLHLQRRTRVQTRIQIPNLMATLHYAEHVHIAENQTRFPTPYFCVGRGIRVRVWTKVCLRQCKWAISSV